MSNDPRWFWQVTFYGNATATFYADSKDLAWDHAVVLARDFGGLRVLKVTRLKHSKDVSAVENAAAGKRHDADPSSVAFAEELRRITRRSRRG